MSQYKKLSTFGEKKIESEVVIPAILKIEDKMHLIQNYKVCVVDVYADWCGPCKIVSPLFSQLFTKYNIPGICILAKENVDLKLSPNIQVVPSFQFFLYGQLESIISGADITLVENKIVELINSNTPSIQPPAKPESSTAPTPPLPPQLQPQFQYQPPPPPPSTQTQAQTQSEGFQHAHSVKQEFYEKPPQLPIQLPIRRKS
jgi:thiol-disulfide isomerase/thioredoxin